MVRERSSGGGVVVWWWLKCADSVNVVVVVVMIVVNQGDEMVAVATLATAIRRDTDCVALHTAPQFWEGT